jgi:ABC-type polysaccharide/polyol phosphate transport system ATPase subunit
MSTSIKFENISKQYRLGLVSTQTLSHDLNRWYQMNIRRKEDPYLTIGDINDRSTKAESDYIWALRNINFEVQQGDVLGIIGKNGAGKSTLLKILSKVTAPTTGYIKAKGRIASLLEVGTGFHPEMTGRENIFMNGAIMGMSKAEITRKFDEIVDFSGVERYIDTPAKRYSSGMTVRLGFAIAAHLDPEILVVDEVLAVGDAEFQKKAIGKMQNVSKGEGRTVLFVSHNMGAIRDLCNKSVILENGTIKEFGRTGLMIEEYLKCNTNTKSTISKNNITIKKLSFDPQPILSNCLVRFELQILSTTVDLVNGLALLIYNQLEQRVAIVDLRSELNSYSINQNEEIRISGTIEQLPIVEGSYHIGIYYDGNFVSQNFLDLMTVNIINDNSSVIKYPADVRGYVNLNHSFEYEIS